MLALSDNGRFFDASIPYMLAAKNGIISAIVTSKLVQMAKFQRIVYSLVYIIKVIRTKHKRS